MTSQTPYIGRQITTQEKTVGLHVLYNAYRDIERRFDEGLGKFEKKKILFIFQILRNTNVFWTVKSLVTPPRSHP